MRLISLTRKRELMYARPPRTNSNDNIRIPENYGGSAFRGGSFSEPRYDISQADRPRVSRADYPPSTDRPQRPELYTEHSADSRIDHSSERETERIELNMGEQNDMPPGEDGRQNGIADGQNSALPVLVEVPNEQREHKSSIFSSLFPPTMLQSHFPFGHGLGTEELLILGMMLMVYMSGNERGETDNELILLLALLLFAG